MGLDLCVESRATPGHEAEWEMIVRRSFADGEISDAEFERFEAISQPAYASLGAPRVGIDVVANDWIAEKMADRMSREEAIAEYHGYYALTLVDSDGLPKYSHGGLYEGVDETSFRGSFLKDCTLVLGQHMIDDAWNHRMPDEAVNYGKALLASASDARNGKTLEVRKRSMLRALFGRSAENLPLEEQLNIVETAGRWFVFWGSRGHPIRAYF
jgi:hypothetical protein